MRVGLIGSREHLADEVRQVADLVPAEVVRDDSGALRGGLRAVLVDAAHASSDPTAEAWDVPTVVVHRFGEEALALAAAHRLSADHVVQLPAGRLWLADLLRPVGQVRVLAVLGCVGGAGASTLAVACTAAAHQPLLVDADAGSPGLDLPLGIPDEAGARWDAVPDGPGPLDLESLRAALPRSDGISVLAGPLPTPAGSRLRSVVAAGRRGYAHVVVDCGRDAHVLADVRADAVIVVTAATPAGVIAARRVLAQLVSGAGPSRVVVAARAMGSRSAAEVAEQVGLDRAVTVPRLRRVAELAGAGDVLSGRTGRRLREVGRVAWRAAR